MCKQPVWLPMYAVSAKEQEIEEKEEKEEENKDDDKLGKGKAM